MVSRRINSTGHVGLIRPYVGSDDTCFPNRVSPEPYDFGLSDEHEWFVDEITAHRRDDKDKLEFEVRWSMGDSTWETFETCKKLAALDRYLELRGVRRVNQLPKRK